MTERSTDLVGPLPHLSQIDGLRAIAVVAVVIYHLDGTWLPGGFLGVDLFMVLSGFLITRLLLVESAQRGKVDLRRFWQRRVKRLMPASIVLIVAVVFASSIVLPATQLGSIRADAASSLVYVANWRFVVDQQSYFDLFADVSPLRHLWSLAIEEQFYLLWPLVVVGLARRVGLLGPVTVALMVASVIAMAVLAAPADPSRAYFGSDTRAHALLAGSLLAWLVRDGFDARRRRVAAVSGPIGAATVATMIVVVDDGDRWMYAGGFVVFALGATALLASVVSAEGGTRSVRLLSTRPLVTIGAASYSIYLWHWPVIVLVSPQRVGLEGAPLVAVQLLLIALLSTCSYICVEQYVRARGWSPRRVATTSAAALATAILAVVISTSGAVDPPDFFSSDGSTAVVLAQETPSQRPAQRPLLLGDSVAASLGDALSTQAALEGSFLALAPVSGCGLLPGVTVGDDMAVYEPSRPCEDSVSRSNRQSMATVKPTLVVWLSAWDAEHREIDGRRILVGTPDGDRAVESLIDARVESFFSFGARTALVTIPRVADGIASDAKQDRIDAYNAVLRSYASNHRDKVELIDLASYVCSTPRGCPDLTPADQRYRPSDGVHFEGAGAVDAATWLLAQIAHT